MGFEQDGYAKSYALNFHVLNLQLQKHHKELFESIKNNYIKQELEKGYGYSKVYKTTAKGTRIKFEITKEKENYFRELRKLKDNAKIVEKLEDTLCKNNKTGSIYNNDECKKCEKLSKCKENKEFCAWII